MKKSTVNKVVELLTKQLEDLRYSKKELTRSITNIGSIINENKKSISEGHRLIELIKKSKNNNSLTKTVSSTQTDIFKCHRKITESQKSLILEIIKKNAVSRKIQEVNSLLNEITPYKKEKAETSQS